jgi:hypothetical protein
MPWFCRRVLLKRVINPLAPSGEIRVKGEIKRPARLAIAFKGSVRQQGGVAKTDLKYCV